MPMQQGPPWFESEGGPRAHAAGASMTPTRRRPAPPRRCCGGLDDPNAREGPAPTPQGPLRSHSEEKAPAPM